MRRTSDTSQLVSIQLLRAAAALSVLLAHIRFDFVTRLDVTEQLKSWEPGMAGVGVIFPFQRGRHHLASDPRRWMLRCLV